MSFWSQLFGSNSGSGSSGKDATPRPTGDYPQSYLFLEHDPKNPLRAKIFEPALRHYPRAFRAGDPKFNSDDEREAWYAARVKVVQHLLSRVATTSWTPHLVLRGSLLLKGWLKDLAREPGDIDWVCIPKELRKDSAEGKKLCQDILVAVQRAPRIDDIRFATDSIATEDIWAYERASGRRLTFPWQAGGLPAGQVQMDFVFCEELFEVPETIQVQSTADEPLQFQCATRALSLSWKLLWLLTDMCPQGKDLYDAALLAERTLLPAALLRRVLKAAEWPVADRFDENAFKNLGIDWDNFKLECPWVEGSATDWLDRLHTALASTFSDWKATEPVDDEA